SFDFISLKIQLDEPMHSGHSIAMFFTNTSGAISSSILTLPIQRNNLGVQVIALHKSIFNATNDVERIVLQWNRAYNSPEIHYGFKLDDWIFQSGISLPITSDVIELNGHIEGSG